MFEMIFCGIIYSPEKQEIIIPVIIKGSKNTSVLVRVETPGSKMRTETKQL